MAQRTEVYLVDDLNGEQGASTRKFGLDGHFYEIDLTDPHMEQLREALAPFATHARRIGRIPGHVAQRDRRPVAPAREPVRTQIPMQTTAEDRVLIRKWWKFNRDRLELPAYTERGRIPRLVEEKYREEHTAPALSDDESRPKARKRAT